jgi:hypothetical protein
LVTKRRNTAATVRLPLMHEVQNGPAAEKNEWAAGSLGAAFTRAGCRAEVDLGHWRRRRKNAFGSAWGEGV